ncbi:unnamed protein product, partial [Allacma fusca]
MAEETAGTVETLQQQAGRNSTMQSP